MTDNHHKALEQIAQAAAQDISGDFPDVDTSYDLWIETLRLHRKMVLVGVVDMGDAWQQTFLWEDGEWHYTSYDPYPIIERIIKKRRNGRL